MPPLILYEDDHLLAVNKPAGINTHAPDRFAQEGLHEWLQRRRGQALGIHQRLDKEVSGVIVFGKTALANAGLTEQFEQRTLRKTYLLLTASPPPDKALRCTVPVDGKPATTTFLPAGHCGRFALVRAEPETGRTHQVRVHAAQLGLPIAGDALYEKPTTSLPRLMLHAAALELKHPHTGQPLRIEAPQPATFSSPDWLTAAREFRSLIFDPGDDNAYRLISAAADGFPGATVDCYANRLLVQWYGARDPQLVEALAPATVIERTMEKQPTGITAPVEKRFEVVENGLRFLVCLDVGYSTGLFLDQRENRRRLLMMDLRGKSVLNAFAYTCGFSVAAARAGAAVTSLDLSKNYLDWGRDNFRLNGLDASAHDFIYGDCFDWLRRLAKKGRQFDLVLLDPPTYSTVKKGPRFSAEKDYPKLVALAEPLVKRGGRLFCASSARGLSPQQFVAAIQRGAPRLRHWEFVTQPFDFRVAASEKPYLKTLWAELD